MVCKGESDSVFNGINLVEVSAKMSRFFRAQHETEAAEPGKKKFAAENKEWHKTVQAVQPILLGLVERTLSRWRADESQCAEVCQNVMVKLFENDGLKNYDPEQKVVDAYLVTMIKHVYCDIYVPKKKAAADEGKVVKRGNVKFGELDFQDEDILEVLFNESEWYHAKSAKEREEVMIEVLDDALEILRHGLREGRQVEAWNLHVRYGWKVGEVAQKLGVSKDSVSLACTRCTAKLRKIIPVLTKKRGYKL